jgi:hypothetical protein
VLAQTVKARGEKIAIHYDIESPDEPARVAGVIRNARNGCYVRQTIGRPEIFEDTIILNGRPFNVDDYPLRPGGSQGLSLYRSCWIAATPG